METNENTSETPVESVSAAAKAATSRTRAIAFVGLSVALIAISAWIVVPFGLIPFTLQMLSIPLVICLFKPTWAISAIYAYVAIGAIGVPVFSGFRGGIGVLLGPTGGFLAGYLLAVPLACGFLYLVRKHASSRSANFACDVLAGIIFTLVAYIFGWIQYSLVAGVSLEVAFVVAVAPFIVLDLVKVFLAATLVQPLRKAIRN